MNVFAAAESDLALSRRALDGGARRMRALSRVLTAVLLCGLGGITLPSSGIADAGDVAFDWEAVAAIAPEDWSPELKEQILQAVADRLSHDREDTRDERGSVDGVDWRLVLATAPEDWSQDLRDQIEAAGHDLEAVARRARYNQRKEESGRTDRAGEAGVDWELVAATAPEDWSDEMKGQILRSVARRLRAGQEREAPGTDRSTEERVWRAAMATDPDEWSERLKAAILELAPGHTLEEIAEGIRQRRAAAHESGSDLEAVGQRIRAAVERGDLTAEEGRGRMAAARRQAAGTEGDNDRLREFQREVAEKAMAAKPEDWSDELKAQIARAGWDLEEFTTGIRQRRIWAEALAAAPEQWSDELKAKIAAAGLDLEAVAERVRHARENGRGASAVPEAL